MVSRSDTLHLLRRTGLTLPSAQVTPLLGFTRAQLVDWIFDFSQNPAVNFAPADRSWSELQRARVWWVDRMTTAPRPLHERMTLFWHNHFATAQRKVSDAFFMWDQNQIFRTQGLGNFSTLAKNVSKDPAMMVWLDGEYSTKWGPNENFSRELLELFLLGVNNGYTETDVREIARAWTGHTIGRDTAYNPTGPSFIADRHDDGNKTIFGSTANWDGPAVLDAMIVSGGALNNMRPIVARHIARKLWTWFATPNASAALLNQLGSMLASTPNMNIEAFLRAMFLMDEFYTDDVKNGLIRDPLLWITSMLRGSGLTFAQANIEWYLDQLSMVPFDPPNVSGWRSNNSWMSVTAFWKRSEVALTVFQNAQRLVADGGSDFLVGMETQAANDVVARALDQFGDDRIAPGSTTWNALVGLVELDRSNGGSSWAQRANLGRAIAISPEYSLA
jgi:uncharacterized protein (DUF1800 family)